MIAGLPLAFVAPAALAALALLPALYFLLRVTPPRPRRVPFPPLRLILDLDPKDETPARTPLWLLVLRMAIAALAILAMAGPIWNPLPPGEGRKGPLLLLVDDGWAAAPVWDQRIAAAMERLDAAGREGRATALVALSQGAREAVPADHAATLEKLRALQPQPFAPDRMAALPTVRAFVAGRPETDIVWICDGLDYGAGQAFADGLAELAGGTSVRVLTADHAVLALAPASNQASGLTVRVLRAASAGATTGRVRALDIKGLPLGEASFTFAGGAETTAAFDLPVELRNEIARVEIEGEKSAGAVSLLDDRWKRRRVGIVSGATADTAQPLLSPTFYITRALGPFADLREARISDPDPIATLLDEHPAMMILADVGGLAGETHDRLARFVESGGVILRFAGSRLAASSDDLVPVKLRRGGRVLGGSLSWETPRRLAPFDRESPLFGLAAPQEVSVTRQVLAEPEAGLPAKTWAQLADGTPLITAGKRGKGMIVLVHVTADTTWSNLPLSGLFIDVLRRVVALSGDGAKATASDGTAAGQSADVGQAAALPPLRILDGFGTLIAPPATARPLPVSFDDAPSLDHPPGFYGTYDGLRALNAVSSTDRLAALDLSAKVFVTAPLRAAEPIDLRPWLIAALFVLFAADALASIALSGGLRGLLGKRAVAAALIAALALAASYPTSSRAAETVQKEPTQKEIDAALTTRLAYVVTGDKRIDEASRLGLVAVSRALAQRTALRPGDPAAVDPARDQLAFYPMIYWPIVADAPQPSPAAVARIAAFMKDGGTIVFDTRDALSTRPGGAPTPEARWLRQLLSGVDVPELEPVPRDHVVTKTFYLLDSFVGRYTIGETWIEALPPETGDPSQRAARGGDSVSPIVITSNDLASAWAQDDRGDALYPLVPGSPRQREFALRGGVNLVMYTLTGSYKADQVHVRDLLERLGH